MPTSYGLDTSTPYTPSAGRVVFVYLRVGSMATEFLGAASVQSDTRRRVQPISVSLAITIQGNDDERVKGADQGGTERAAPRGTCTMAGDKCTINDI